MNFPPFADVSYDSTLRDSRTYDCEEPRKKSRTTSGDSYDDYLMAMRRAYQHLPKTVPVEMRPARERYRQQDRNSRDETASPSGGSWDMHQATRISTLVSMVPDEIIYNYKDTAMRSYETALMFIDVSGFTELCETYTKDGRGGPSKLTQVLNSYIGAMVQEILAHNGDVLKFSGDAFLSTWKTNSSTNMPQVVHSAIDCGLIIQKNYGTHVTDVGVVLKVKVAISAGMAHFCIIGDENNMAHYVIIGQPVWDVKMAEYISTAGDVLTSANVWTYVNETEYCTQPCGDGRHTKVLGVGIAWKRVEKMGYAVEPITIERPELEMPFFEKTVDHGYGEISIRAFALRPSVIISLRGTWWPALRRFMLPPVLRAVDNDEPMDFLTEIRHVVVVFVNIIIKPVSEDVLIEIVDSAYKCVCRLTSASGGLVNKISMFDKDMMFLIIYGHRGFKRDDEVQKALLCAADIKETLQDANIISVSIGITTGTTYCGVVGHVLRREYTVIGPAVNKAARIMIAYRDRITCDKETFVRSKLPLHLFKLMPKKVLKGIADSGPIYEFNNNGFPDQTAKWRHPLLGRNDEMRNFLMILQNAIAQDKLKFIKYRDHKYAVILVGRPMVGKTRLMNEFLNMAPSNMTMEIISLSSLDEKPYRLIKVLLYEIFAEKKIIHYRDNMESLIKNSVDVVMLKPIQVKALNDIFDCRLPLPDHFIYDGDVFAERSIKFLVHAICKTCFPELRVAAINNAQFIDDYSWKVLMMLMESKCLFLIMSIPNEVKLSDVATNCLSNGMIVKMNIPGIDRWYQAALTCQLLDVQAIPADLEKVIESASNGRPGWIQNFVISLIQRGDLTVVTVSRHDAIDAGAVMPSPMLIHSAYDHKTQSLQQSTKNVSDMDIIQMAVLPESFQFNDVKCDLAMDVLMLQTYDSLNPFEKMLLKCASVIGEHFSKRGLSYLMQMNVNRKFSQAIARLFEIRVLECAGGDFTCDTSLVIIHPSPVKAASSPPFCSCIGIYPPHNCEDLPQYAFCGYMSFKHSLFQKTTYDLLTENQKMEMHSRAMVYLERNTRRCISCGGGCFYKLFGVRYDDGMMPESPEKRRVRLQMAALAAESTIPGEMDLSYPYDVHTISTPAAENNIADRLSRGDYRRVSDIGRAFGFRVRSFSSLTLDKCECLMILLSVYTEIINHMKAVGDCDKLFITYMEFADLSLINVNTAQAFRLLKEAEKFVFKPKVCNTNACHIPWLKDHRYAKILSLRAFCLLETGDVTQAKSLLLRALRLMKFNYPTSKFKLKYLNFKTSFQLLMAIYVAPRSYVGIYGEGMAGQYCEDMACTLNCLYIVLCALKDKKGACLAAKLNLYYALRSNSSFRIMCIAYGNMIAIYRQQQKYLKCQKLEHSAVELCHRKKGQLDITEVHAVCDLYTNIFLYHSANGRVSECLRYGLSVIPLITIYSDLTMCQLLVLWMLKMLISDLRLNEMVMIMREIFYSADHYDYSSETWYYYYSMVILLDTGYCVETYSTCEQFYVKKGDFILRSKTPEAAWNFFVVMWLVSVRIGSWERAILWNEKMQNAMKISLPKREFVIMIFVRMLEGKLILMVREMEKKNLKNIKALEASVQDILEQVLLGVKIVPLYKPRVSMLRAYYNYIKGKKTQAFKMLHKAFECSKMYNLCNLNIWIQHTFSHWKGTLSEKYLNHWVEHIEPDSVVDYETFDYDRKFMIPYTLPIPKDHY